MTKKAVIVISLVEESIEKANEEIEKEILEGLSKGLHACRKQSTSRL